MKNVSTLLTLSVLTSLYAFATTQNPATPSPKVYQLLQGSTVQTIQQKRGLAVDMEYQSQHVGVNQLSQVNITLLTHLTKGILRVDVSSENDALEGIKQNQYKFILLEIAQENRFPIHLELKSEKEGIHYVNLEVTLEGDETRLFSVPVNIGKVEKVLQKKAVTLNDEGDSMSISQAVEEIK